MKFTIKSDQLLKELQLIQGIIERKTTIPILSNLLIRVKNSIVEIEATDLEIGMKCKTSAEISQDGEITVNARKIYDLVKSLPGLTLEFELVDKKDLQITAKNVKYSIPTLPASEYPGIPVAEMDTATELPLDELKKSVSKVIIAAAVDDTRYTLNGIYTVLSADSIIMVATDAHRLALSEIKDKLKNIDGETNFIIPRKGAQEVMNLLKEADSKEGSKLLFKAEQNNIFFKIGDKLLVSRVIEGKYPQYEKVIPKGNDIELTFNKEALKQVLNRIDLVASEKSHAVIFSFEKSHVKIYSSSPEFGEGEEKLEINYGGEEFKIAFNARYLIDFLNSANTDNVIMKLKDSNTAGMLKEEKNEDYIYIVSPIKL